jgi:hypothetical protein
MTTSSALLTHYKVNEQSIDVLRLVFISSQATAQNTKVFGPAYQLISVKASYFTLTDSGSNLEKLERHLI